MIDHNLIAGIRAVTIVLFCVCNVLNFRAFRSTRSAGRGNEPLLTSYPIIFTAFTALMIEVFVGSYFVGP